MKTTISPDDVHIQDIATLMAAEGITPDVSVIIVNYRTSQLVADCMKSVISNTSDISYEIIVADNDSEPDLSNFLLKQIQQSYPSLLNENKSLASISVLSLDGNLGFGKANNEAASTARGEYLFFLNPDTLLLDNAVATLADFLERTPVAGCCGGNLHDADGKPAFSFRRLMPGPLFELNELWHHQVARIMFGSNYCHNHTKEPMAVGFISGADLFIRKDTFMAIGGFDTDFFMYFEETDLCRRMNKKTGLKAFNVPTANITHLEGKSLGTDWDALELKASHQENSRCLYYRKNSSTISHSFSDFLHGLFLLSRIFLSRDKDKKRSYKIYMHHFQKERRRLKSRRM